MNGMRKYLFWFAAIAILCALGGWIARAQGSRKDNVVFNAQGRPMAGATVRVCTSAATGQPCSPLALIYSDAALTQALANPTTTDGLGNYTFYAAPGRYEVEISQGPSIITKQLPNVILPSDPTAPTFTTVTTTSGISAFSLSLSGNLTVNGSAAVTGSLTVGGSPVPSTSRTISGPPRSVSRDPTRGATSRLTCPRAAATNPRLRGLTPPERLLPARLRCPSPTTTTSKTAAAFSSPTRGPHPHFPLPHRARRRIRTSSARRDRQPFTTRSRPSTRISATSAGQRGHHGHVGFGLRHADQLRGRVLAGSRGRGRVSRLQRCRRKLRSARILFGLLWIQRRRRVRDHRQRKGRRRIPGPGSTDSGRPGRLRASPIKR